VGAAPALHPQGNGLLLNPLKSKFKSAAALAVTTTAVEKETQMLLELGSDAVLAMQLAVAAQPTLHPSDEVDMADTELFSEAAKLWEMMQEQLPGGSDRHLPEAVLPKTLISDEERAEYAEAQIAEAGRAVKQLKALLPDVKNNCLFGCKGVNGARQHLSLALEGVHQKLEAKKAALEAKHASDAINLMHEKDLAKAASKLPAPEMTAKSLAAVDIAAAHKMDTDRQANAEAVAAEKDAVKAYTRSIGKENTKPTSSTDAPKAAPEPEPEPPRPKASDADMEEVKKKAARVASRTAYAEAVRAKKPQSAVNLAQVHPSSFMTKADLDGAHRLRRDAFEWAEQEGMEANAAAAAKDKKDGVRRAMAAKATALNAKAQSLHADAEQWAEEEGAEANKAAAAKDSVDKLRRAKAARAVSLHGDADQWAEDDGVAANALADDKVAEFKAKRELRAAQEMAKSIAEKANELKDKAHVVHEETAKKAQQQEGAQEREQIQAYKSSKIAQMSADADAWQEEQAYEANRKAAGKAMMDLQKREMATASKNAFENAQKRLQAKPPTSSEAEARKVEQASAMAAAIAKSAAALKDKDSKASTHAHALRRENSFEEEEGISALRQAELDDAAGAAKRAMHESMMQKSAATAANVAQMVADQQQAAPASLQVASQQQMSEQQSSAVAAAQAASDKVEQLKRVLAEKEAAAVTAEEKADAEKKVALAAAAKADAMASWAAPPKAGQQASSAPQATSSESGGWERFYPRAASESDPLDLAKKMLKDKEIALSAKAKEDAKEGAALAASKGGQQPQATSNAASGWERFYPRASSAQSDPLELAEKMLKEKEESDQVRQKALSAAASIAKEEAQANAAAAPEEVKKTYETEAAAKNEVIDEQAKMQAVRSAAANMEAKAETELRAKEVDAVNTLSKAEADAATAEASITAEAEKAAAEAEKATKSAQAAELSAADVAANEVVKAKEAEAAAKAEEAEATAEAEKAEAKAEAEMKEASKAEAATAEAAKTEAIPTAAVSMAATEVKPLVSEGGVHVSHVDPVKPVQLKPSAVVQPEVKDAAKSMATDTGIAQPERLRIQNEYASEAKTAAELAKAELAKAETDLAAKEQVLKQASAKATRAKENAALRNKDRAEAKKVAAQKSYAGKSAVGTALASKAEDELLKAQKVVKNKSADAKKAAQNAEDKEEAAERAAAQKEAAQAQLVKLRAEAQESAAEAKVADVAAQNAQASRNRAADFFSP